MGRGGVMVGVGARFKVSSGVLGSFRFLPSHNTGITGRPRQISRTPLFILDNNQTVW